MTFSYTSPGNSLSDEVRYRTGDTIEALALLSDEEIAWELSEAGNDPLQASLASIDKMLGLLARDTLTSADGISRDLGERRKAVEATRAQLIKRTTLAGGVPWAGGASVSERTTRRADTSLIPPDFYRGRDDHPEANESSWDSEIEI